MEKGWKKDVVLEGKGKEVWKKRGTRKWVHMKGDKRKRGEGKW